MAEGAERLRLEARFAVANRFADEQIRLSAALLIAKGAEREGLLAEQAALDRNVKSIDSLIAAKLEQLRVDERATALASFQRALAEREAPQLIVSPLPDVIPGLAEALRAEEEAARLAAQHVDITRVAVDALSDGLANAAAHARSLGDALRSIALTVTSSLLRTFLPGLIAGAFRGGGGSTSTIAFPFVSRQAGGPLRAGQTAIVGEDGPELFRSNVAGDIIPSGVGGVSIGPFTFNIESSDGPGVRAALADVVPVLRDQVTQAVRQTLRVDSRRPSPA